MEAATAGVDRLMARTAVGDDLAFTELYVGTREQLLAVSLRIVGDPAIAEEALHDAFIKIWMHAASYRSEAGPALAWMSAIVRNRTRDIARRLRELPDVDERLAAHVVDPSPPPEDIAAGRLEARALCECVAALDPGDRQAIALAFTRDMSHAEVARHLGRPLGTVKTQIRRGILRLRECMSACERDARAGAPS